MADQTRSSLVIDADPPRIMAVIADFPAYPEWTGLISAADVLSAHPDGRPEQVHFVLNAGVVQDDYVLGYTWDGDRSVRWSLVRGNAQKSQDGSYTLVPQGASTLVEYELAVDLKMSVLGMFKRKAEKVIVDTALRGLKKRVES